ncbi:MAG: MBL fold metallo-hydrolase [Ignavibacteria bacterium]|nr:MBL fold metallo-hydrolase [Ignavibacteria bacterium]MBT8382128.1 MBL fold metallo-hydrolase [Ignavibacteria bacterium]MBT8392584.1 MBL fold metallo-hydrolase [Ignavibacteria bacterium]NNJ53808.1 MBL fold metallo-hydrolase [Ignavibacteriaceae bacterium]
MMNIKSVVFNNFAENTILLWDDETKEAAVVDPGMYTKDEEKIFDDYLVENNLQLKALINTHCHIDHILGCGYVKNKYKVDYYAPEKDLLLLKNAATQAEMFGLNLNTPPEPDKLISEETEFSLGNVELKFLFTPGHTPGEFCIYIKTEKICVTGDVLFKEGIGRTDLWGGDYNTLINSIKQKLFTLPDDVKIFPGHGDPSTIGHEKQNNPFLN